MKRNKYLKIFDQNRGRLCNCKLFDSYGFKLKLLKSFFDDCEEDTIVWIYHPGYGHYLDMIPKKCRIIYDCVDDYKTFPEFSSDDMQEWIDKLTFNEALCEIEEYFDEYFTDTIDEVLENPIYFCLNKKMQNTKNKPVFM